MRTVREVMRGDVEVLRTSDSAADAACYLAAHADEWVPVCLDDGRLVGAVTARDIVTHVVAKGLDPRQVTLGELAELGAPAQQEGETGQPAAPDGAVALETLALEAGVSVDEAAAVMCRLRRTRLPVVDGRRVVGHVTQRDVVRSVAFQPSWESGV
jgi:CBS domain-containing protein